MVPSPAIAERRLSQELQAKLEVLRLHPAQNGEEDETVETVPRMTRSANTTPRPPSIIPPTSRSNSVLGTLVPREASTRFSQYHAVPMHNYTAEDSNQNHTLGLVVPRNQDSDETDLEVTEIIASTASNSPASRPADGEMSLDNFFDVSHKPMEVNVYEQDKSTIPAANTFTAIQSSNEWLKRYLPDVQNSQLGNIPNKVEVTTEDGEEWYRVRIPYLHRFYDTEIYLVGKQNN